MKLDYRNASLEPVFLEPIPVVVDDGPGTGFEYPPHPGAVAWAVDWFTTHRCPFIADWERERAALWGSAA